MYTNLPIIEEVANKEMETEGRFCVVGGDGFIGSLLVNSLLQRGFSVHATILPTSSGNDDIHYLQRLPGAHERLKLFNADLRVEGSFDSPISDCQGVFLVASPMEIGSKDPENEVAGVIQGTINVLKSCLKAKTVKRVVLTSSSCAMSPLNEEGKMNNNPCSVEYFWSPVNHFRSNKEQFPIWPYFVSKTLAEQTAWSFAKENNIDLVTIGPSVVGGHFITPYIPSSIHALLWFLPGNKEVLNCVARSILAAFGTFPVVHISDVCNAHIFLMEQPAAEGRYLCSVDALSVEELEQLIIKRYPDLQIINMSEDVDFTDLLNTHFMSEKLTDLGFTFKHGIEEIYDDCIESYNKLGLLTTQ